jgi:hypothetical protein
VQILGTPGRVGPMPITFGQPFPPGAVTDPAGLSARDSHGHDLPLQVDQTVTAPDGSLRHAVLSTLLDTPKPGAREMVALYRDKPVPAPAGAPPDIARLLADGYDLTVSLDTYAAAITEIRFGNRGDGAALAPFTPGQTVVVELGDDPAERFTVTIDADLAKPEWDSFDRLEQRFEALINRDSRRFSATRSPLSFERMLVSTRDLKAGGFGVRVSTDGPAPVTTREIQAVEPVRRYTISARTLLEAGAGSPRLDGPVLREVLAAGTPVDADGTAHPALAVRFAIRFAGPDRPVRTDVTLSNDWGYGPAPRNYLYDIAFEAGGRTLFAHKAVDHYAHARWHHTVWSDGAPDPVVLPDNRSLVASRAVPNYDLSLPIEEPVLAQLADRLAKANTGPLGNALVAPYMPMSGGRSDIGPLPQWAALYVTTLDPRARAALLANGDASGSVPVHFRDPATGLPISLDTHPLVAMGFGRTENADALPLPLLNTLSPWTPDAAHHPSLSFLPYVVTGDVFYLEELQAWANWVMGVINPGYRGEAQGLVYENQMRGQAWSMRTLFEAAWITPDHDPMKAYFTRKLDNNIKWYIANVAEGSPPRTYVPLGYLDDERGETHDLIPWMDDFFTLTIARMVEAGVEQARPLMLFKSRFAADRWLVQDQGYCWGYAPAQFLRVHRPGEQALVDGWRGLFQATWPQVTSCPNQLMVGGPDVPYDYAAISRATLAVLTGQGIPAAVTAYHFAVAHTPLLDAAYRRDPTWAILPRPLS